MSQFRHVAKLIVGDLGVTFRAFIACLGRFHVWRDTKLAQPRTPDSREKFHTYPTLDYLFEGV
jgi:hypothetical protein